jgi:diguanylate cyclase (GGDEF)-like protein
MKDDPFRTYKSAGNARTPMPSSEACLVFIYPTGPQMGARFVLKPGETFIGRTEECQIRNTDGSVSRLHARIDGRNDGFWVIDLDSTNGTFVNNVPKREALLGDGDYLRIGNCIYRFLAGGNLEAEYHEEIYRLTVQDGLTGVHNRRYLTEFIDRELARAQRFQRPLALGMFDIDYFKNINDVHGHLAGDTVLRELASLLKAVVRKDELLARYGGEEFAIVLPETDRDAAALACERLRWAVENHSFVYHSARLPVTVSVGVAISSAETTGPDELFRAADANLYEAKRAGRNRVVS